MGSKRTATQQESRPVSPLMVLAGCWLLGVVLGGSWGWSQGWLVAASIGATPMAWHVWRRRYRAGRCWGGLALICLAAAWTSLRLQHVESNDIARFIIPEPQLARVTGVVDGPMRVSDAPRGAFSRFSYTPVTQSFVLRVESIVVEGREHPAGGQLLVRIGQEDHRIRDGDRIRVSGWLGPFREPLNPGERDYKTYMTQRGVGGVIRLPYRGNWELLGRSRWRRPLGQVRAWFSDHVARSLRIGLDDHPARVAFLDRILLGRRHGQLGDLETSFRRVGLAHLLSISGAHLGILLGLLWLVARLLCLHPQRAAIVVLIVLGLYLMAVPLRVPIIRAGVMAGFLCTGYAMGRAIRPLDLLALAAVVLLIWEPADFFTAGFQLSFGVVYGLLMFTQTTSHLLWPDPPVIVDADRGRIRMIRWGVTLVSAHLVAFAVAMPLVAYHFGMVSPLSVILSLVAYPWITALMAVGYLKISLGLLLPSTGLVLAGPLEYLSDTMTGLIQHAANWPAATVELSTQPSLAWVIGTLAVIVALLDGWLARRRRAACVALAVCLVWLIGAEPVTKFVHHGGDFPDQPPLRLNMLAVGNGSCYVVRIASRRDRDNGPLPAQNKGDDQTAVSVTDGAPHVLMFDCGSQGYWDVGTDTVVPALRHLGVRSIDTLMLSHADLDHFNGVLAVIDHLPVDRVLVSSQMLVEAQNRPDGAAAFLIHQLRGRGIEPRVVSRGWVERRGCGTLELLWPPAEFESLHANETSLVLSIQTEGRRVLLNGDIQDEAMSSLVDSGIDLSADICDLPHHGGIVRDSIAWLEAVSPSLVLQSCGPSRLTLDPWPSLLNRLAINRLVSAQVGMVEVTVDRTGGITWQEFRPP